MAGDKLISQGQGPPSWPVPRRRVPAASLFLIFLLSLPHFPVGPPVAPFTGQLPSHTRFLLEKITVEREACRDWEAEKQRKPSLLLEACSLDPSALVWGRTMRCADTDKRVFFSQLTPSPPSVSHLPTPRS